LQIFEYSDEKQYDKISIRKHVLNNSRKKVVSKSMMKKKISSSIESQLFIFDDTSSFKSTSISIFIAIEISKFLFRKETSDKKMINLSRKNQSLNKKNNIFFRKKNSLCSNLSKLSKKFFETKNVLLNVLTSKDITFRINVVNIVRKKRVRKFSKDFANMTWINEKMTRILVFHTIMMIVFNTKTSKFEIKTTSSFTFHINNLSKSFLHWRIMLRHSHVERFLKIAQMKYDVIETKEMWKIVDKRDDYKLISLKWIFIYKSDSNDFLSKYKTRIIIRDDLQKVNNVQNVYVATLELKIYRMMMTFVVDFHFQIKQLNVVNFF
jgi:hypothetical protein